MAEYEKAYELSLQGKIKLISFIRRSIWDIREDRKGLKDYIRSEKWVSEKSDIEKIAKHNCSIIQDADIVFSFIRMVTRTSEVIEAIEKKTNLPKNNWIYQFENFEDIIKTLKTQLLLNNDLSELILLENLINELEEIVSSLIFQKRW
jgi:precorrin-6B methylase 1